MQHDSELYNLLIRPIVSEKSTGLAALNQYVFQVVAGSNKVSLSKAFEKAFPGRKVTDVRLIKMRGKVKRRGKRTVRTHDWVKAVFSITGEPLELLAGA